MQSDQHGCGRTSASIHTGNATAHCLVPIVGSAKLQKSPCRMEGSTMSPKHTTNTTDEDFLYCIQLMVDGTQKAIFNMGSRRQTILDRSK
jgi:hypothetical protein